MPLPPESLAKALQLQPGEPIADLLGAGDNVLPGDAVARIEIEHDAVAGFQTIEPRAADVNLERTGLHQFDQLFALLDRDDVMLLGFDDVAQRRLLDVLRDVLLEKALSGGSFRAAQHRQRPADDMRRHGIPCPHVIGGEILLGDAGIGPIDAIRMRQTDAGDFDVFSVAARGP